LSKTFSSVAINLGIHDNDNDNRFTNEQSLVLACFATLLTDAEAEVRAAAVAHLARMIAWGGPELFQVHLQPLLPALGDDPVMEVRSKCALALMDAAEGRTLDDALLLQAFEPLLEAFLQDEFHEVQLQVLTNLHKVSHLLPGLSGVVSSLLHMTKATNWRVRESIAILMPHLAEAKGVEFFQTVLLGPVWLPLLLDPVASVRAAVVHGMQLLVQVAGEEWIATNLFPEHVKIYNANSYLIRITILQAHVEVACQTKSGQLWQDAVAQIIRGAGDKVANVRMVAARGLGKVVQEGGDASVVESLIRPLLEKRVAEEEDPDCRQACVLALEQIQ
jgi:serine/threonine-protein phosphatase 2A regulatory subunit A